jgi:hypothetical protein
MQRNKRIARRTQSIQHSLALLILLFCFGPMRVRAAAGGDANPFEAPARELARRVAGNISAGMRVQVEVRNRSSLGEGDVDAVRAALLGELGARGLRVGADAGSAVQADASATITLSENTEGFLWIAEIEQGDRSSVVLMAVPRASDAPTADNSGITLRSALVWSGAEHVLAAAMPGSPRSAAAASPNLLLLVSDGASASVIDARRTFKIALPPFGDALRDAQGTLTWSAATVTAIAGGQACALAMPLAASQPQCRAAALATSDAPSSLLGSQRADFSAVCGQSSGEILAAGMGDYTQPDSVRVFEPGDGTVIPASPALDLPGPVMSLQAEPNSSAALAVVHNLATGDDEIYEISLVCGR